jgi:hypothetical protein
LEDHPITAQLFLAAGAGETGMDAFLDDRTLDSANTPIIRRKASSASSQNRGLYLDQAGAAARSSGRGSSNRALTRSINCCFLNRKERFGGGNKMCSRYRKLQVGIIYLGVISFGCEGAAQDLTTRATGCFGSDGTLSRLALGDNPLEGCPHGEEQVSLKLDDLSDGAAAVPFFVTLLFGEEQTIAENGALALRARCILGLDTSADALELVVTSTLDGWFATSPGESTTVERRIEDEVVLFTALGPGRLSGLGGDRLTGAQLALAPDGSFLALASGSTALGVNLFNQDCVAIGTVSLIRGDLTAARRFGQPLENDGISVGIGLDDRISSSIDSLGAPDISQRRSGFSQLDGGISGLGK